MKKSRRHALGQHFLHNPRVLDRIIRTIDPQQDDLIIEIGAGRGALTFRMAEAAGRVFALEKDASLLPELESRRLANLEIRRADILRTPLSGLAGSRPVKLVGNLPYSISSPILFKAVRERDVIRECHFLLQREFAERAAAGPGTRKYAPLSILIQNAYRTQIRFRVAPGSFTPPPAVESAFLSLFKRESPLHALPDEDRFRRFLQACFSQRRKTLSNNLRAWAPPGTDSLLRDAGVDGSLRPEAVPIEDFVRLFRLLA
jgi:16S rRNA (adenine1518-N6/adenine1519-N6)-dimethyltransferase